jgi:3-deoxy-7-phosphoheptulonate synthase
MSRVSDTRVVAYEPLLTPAALLDELPLGDARAVTVERSRAEVRAVLDGADDRLLVVVGPCSVHDPVAALDYAGRLARLRDEDAADLLVVMLVYFEKPRTVTGWKGLINDPRMDGSHDVHRGLRLARRLLLDVLRLGLPVGCEWLDPITPQYLADAVAWAAIGASTTESQVHRQMASGLSMPVGFKNGTDGDVQVAVDACRAAAAGHTFFGVTRAGAAAVVTTAGNPDTHVILRGGRSGPNYQPKYVSKALDLIGGAGLPRRVMVDASHGHSSRDHRHAEVASTVADQVADGQHGLAGIVLEGCMDVGDTAEALGVLAGAVRQRRGQSGTLACWPQLRRGRSRASCGAAPRGLGTAPQVICADRPEPSSGTLSQVHPSVFSRGFQHAVPHFEDLLTRQRRDVVQQQLGQLLPELGWRQHVAHLLVVRRLVLQRRQRCRCGAHLSCWK